MTQPLKDPMLPQPWTVSAMRWENQHTFTLDCQGPAALPFAPGQFNMLYVFGVGEVPISISGSPQKSDTLVHTIRDVGTVTHALGTIQPGQQIGIRGPFGTPWPMEAARGKDILVIAGGLGLAPVRPILYHVLENREDYGELTLLYGARNPEEILFEPELHQWRGRFDMDVQVTVDRADQNWRGPVGVITHLIKKSVFNPNRTVAMVCGPEIMMRFSAIELEHHGLPAEQIYVSLERNMKCAVGFCGHCQYGPHFICKDGPVFTYGQVQHLMEIREV